MLENQLQVIDDKGCNLVIYRTADGLEVNGVVVPNALLEELAAHLYLLPTQADNFGKNFGGLIIRKDKDKFEITTEGISIYQVMKTGLSNPETLEYKVKCTKVYIFAIDFSKFLASTINSLIFNPNKDVKTPPATQTV